MMGEALAHQGNVIQVADEGQAASAAPVMLGGGAVHWPVLERLLDIWPLRIVRAFEQSWGLKVRVERGVIRTGRIRKSAHELAQYSLRGEIGHGEDRDAGLVVIEPVCLYGVLEFILGDRSASGPETVPNRPANPFEAGLMRPLAAHLLSTFRSCLATAGDLPLDLRRWLPEGDDIDDAPALVAPLTLHFGAKSGVVALIIPLSVMTPLAPALGGLLHGADPASAEAWRLALRRRVLDASLTLTAVLHEETLPLSRIAGLKPGETIVFDAAADTPVGLYAQRCRVAEGALGCSGQKIAIRLTRSVATGENTS